MPLAEGRLAMRGVKTGLIGIAGILAGLLLGYALWGLQVVELSFTLGKTTNELLKTQAWLNDEIRSSDERQEEVLAQLTKALGELTKARAELTRLAAAARRRVSSSETPRPTVETRPVETRPVELPPPPPPWTDNLR
jgi:hypothetical protein